MINVIIVDDEPLAQDVLETYIEKLPDLNLVQKCSNAFEAMEGAQSARCRFDVPRYSDASAHWNRFPEID